MYSLFFSKAAEISVVGLQASRLPSCIWIIYSIYNKASGKTSFVNVISNGQVRHIPSIQVLVSYLDVGQWSEDVVPTVAFNFRKVRKGKITFKIWDVAGA